MKLKDKLTRGLAAAGKKVVAGLERADELGGEVRDWVNERYDIPVFKKITDRLAHVSKADFKEFDDQVRRTQERAIAAARTDAAPPPTAAEVAATRRTGLGDPEVAAQVYGRESCPWTGRAMTLLNDNKVDFDFIDLDDPEHAHFEGRLIPETKQNTVPWIYLRGEFIGGFNALSEIARLGQLEERLKPAAQRVSKIEVVKRANSDERAPGEVADPAEAAS